MSIINLTETQKDEVIALKSIFGQEFKLHRPKNLKKTFQPPYMSIIVSHSGSVFQSKVFVKLWFDCSANYPISAPVITLTEAESISSDLQESLIKLLRDKSSELLGTPMIHILVECAREFLDSSHKAIESPKELQVIDSEIKVINQRDLRLQLLRERKDSAKKETFHVKFIEKCSNPSHNDSLILKFDHCVDKVGIEVYKGVCEGGHQVTSIIGDGRMVINCFEGFHLTRGCGVIINQISLQNLSKKTLDMYKKNLLKKLEEDFYFLYKLSHCNVMPYLGFRHQITEKVANNERTFELDIQYLTPNMVAMKLGTQCSMEASVDISGCTSSRTSSSMAKIRLYVTQVLDGVRYLHERNVTNIKINVDSMSIDKDFNLQISHYYIGRRFQELKTPKEREDSVNSAKKGSKRHDIAKVGKFAKQLFFYGRPDNDGKEEEIPGELMGFIDCARSNISDLHKHPFLCPPIQSKDPSEEHENDLPTEDLSEWERFDKSSRIPTEFELIGKLGEGAFGDVVKVKNIYDLQYYAIKRVRLNTLKTKASKRTMKEVQLLSTLNHENIVRYYSSWSEEVVIPESDNLTSSSSDNNQTKTSSIVNNLSLGRSILNKRPIDSSLFGMEQESTRVNSAFFKHPSKSNTHHFYDINSDSDSDSDLDLDEDEDENINEFSDNIATSTPFVSSKGYINSRSVKDPQPVFNKIFKFLMIQMELCEGSCNTLHKYIDEEQLYLNEKLIWKFIREISSGLEHIHTKNMIHRDLKPANIFIDHHKKVKIGDLGLATSFLSKPSSNVLDESNIISSDKGMVGTWLYICPEMESLKPYNNKADMYSLGVIVFEMCHTPFGTANERYNILGQIRKPEITFPSDKEFKIKDKFKELIACLLNHDPSQRPSASELLQSNIIPPPEAREMELRRGLTEITKDRSSNIYKLLLTNMFNQSSTKMGAYELPLLYQSPFKYFISNTKPYVLHLTNKKSHIQIDEGDYTFFTTRRLIIRAIESVFLSHGAVEFMAPILSPKTAFKESQAFTVLDCEGTVVNLPTNLRENFANFILNNDINISRRFAIGPTYHQQEYRRDHPKELLEAAFDIVCDYDSNHKKVECLFVLHEVFSKLFNREHIILTLEINHIKLFNGLMEYYRITDSIQQRIVAQINEKTDPDMSYLDSEEVRQNTSLTESQVAHLKSILTYCGRLEDLEKFLKIYINKARENLCCKAITDAFNELLSVVEMLERFPSPLCFEVNVRPIFVPKQHLYKGFVFQLLIQVQDKFVDIVKPSSDGNTNKTIKYLRNTKKVCLGGDYSDYLMKSGRQMVSEDGDVTRFVSATGLSIDLSTLIQCIYSMEQLLSIVSEAEGKYDNVTNSAVSVVVQYDAFFDKICREMLSSLWKMGLATVLYDKDDSADNYVLENKIEFVVKFLKQDDRRATTDYRVIVKRNDFRSIGLEQVSSDDCKTISRAMEVIIKEQKKRETFVAKFNRECIVGPHKSSSEPASPDIGQDLGEFKKPFGTRTESTGARYVYVFVSAKDGRQTKIELKYVVETLRQIQSLRHKNIDIDLTNVQMLVNLNKHLINMSKWFHGKFPGQLYIIIVELSYAKCTEVTSEVSLKSIKDLNKLSQIIVKIESSVNYNSNVERHWKDVVTRTWRELQEAVKDKIYKVLIHSLTDDNLVFVDIK